jgi:hypothetical protein
MEEVMELRSDELRQEGRPLWMTDLGVESTADLVSGGGDIHANRPAVDWGREVGEDLIEELDPIDIEILLTSGHYDDCCIS